MKNLLLALFLVSSLTACVNKKEMHYVPPSSAPVRIEISRAQENVDLAYQSTSDGKTAVGRAYEHSDNLKDLIRRLRESQQ